LKGILPVYIGKEDKSKVAKNIGYTGNSNLKRKTGRIY
jgi:hypothetical protein